MSDNSTAPIKGNGRAIAALVLGIIAVVFSFIPIAGLWIALVPAVLAIVFGLTSALSQAPNKLRSFISAGLGALAILIGIITFVTGITSVGKAVDSITESIAPTTEATVPAETPTPEQPAAPEVPAETMGQKNAKAKAASYLEYSSFSRSGLIGQLEYEGFSTEDSTYGTDALGVDWNEQAALKAKSYLEYSSFSRAGLIDQLLYEGFSEGEAEYGASQNGY